MVIPKRFTVFQITLSVLACATAMAVPPPKLQGSMIARVDDNVGNGRCIGSADMLTVTLRRVILEKKSSWFGLVEDKSFGLTFTTTVTGKSGGEGKSASFAKVVQQSVSPFGVGQISLGVEQSLLSKYSLTNGTNEFTVVDINVGIVRTQGKSVAANILLGAVGATKSLSLPANPFTSAYSNATNYVDNLFAPLLKQASDDKVAIADNITMNINSGNCSGDDEKTGTKAIIEASTAPNVVDTSKPNNYCFAADLSPAFVLKFAPKPAGGQCTQVSSYTAVPNSYIAFYVNSLPPQQTQPKPAAASSLTFPPPGEATRFDRRAVRSALQDVGIKGETADEFAHALASSLSSTQIGEAFGVSPVDVDKYRETLARCKANSHPIATCFK